MTRNALGAALALLCASTLPAQQTPGGGRGTIVLTRREAVAQALEHNPQLLAARERFAEARARRTQATALPDPEVVASAEDQRRLLDPNGAGTKNVGLGVTIPFPTKLYLSGRVADADVGASDLAYLQTRQSISSETTQAYNALLAAIRIGRDLAEAERFADEFLQKTQTLYEGGVVAGIDIVKAKVEVARARNQLIANEADVATARAHLNRLLGRLLGAGLGLADSLAVPPPVPGLELVESRALLQRPELQSLALQRQGASAAHSLARQFWLPDISVGVTKDFAAGAATPYVTEIGFGVPLFFWQHRGGEVAEARHIKAELAAVNRDLAAQVSEEVRVAHATASTARRQVVFLRDELLPEAREAFRIATVSYGLGGASALEVLDAQRTLLEAEGEYTDALASANDARAQLELAMGAPLESLTSGDSRDR